MSALFSQADTVLLLGIRTPDSRPSARRLELLWSSSLQGTHCGTLWPPESGEPVSTVCLCVYRYTRLTDTGPQGVTDRTLCCA